MNITWEDVILETLPFSQELIDWCKTHSEFQKGLKALASKRFLHLGVIMPTHPPGTEDKVFGIYAYDYKNKPPLFKQDFIVDVDGAHKEFILYSGFPKGIQSTKYVRHINDFYQKYGENGNYANGHHLTFDQLPLDSELRERATRMISRSKNLPEDITNPPQQMLIDFLRDIRIAKEKDGGIIIRKLDRLN